MDISVVIPCYNAERYLRRCLEALLTQSYPRDRYEVIVVDNESADRSAEIARKHPGVTVLRETKQSSYAARNTGVRASTGKILAFTDSDCEVCPVWLERINAAMEDERTAVVLGGRRFASEAYLLSTLADYEAEKARYVFAQDDRTLYYAYTNNMAVKRDVFERCGPFVEMVRGADVVFVSKVLEAFSSQSVRYCPDALLRHLEVARFYDWHRKMWIYGKSYGNYHQLSHTRPLSYRSRLEVLRRTVRLHHYSLPRTILVLLSGVAATVAYSLGKTVGSRKRSGASAAVP